MADNKYRPMMSEKQKTEMEKRRKNAEKNGEPLMDMESESTYYYPDCLRVNDRQLPDIDNWEVGKEYKVSLIVKMTEYSANSKTNKNSARLEIMGIKAENGKLDTEQKKIVDFMVGGNSSEDDDEDED